MRSPLWQMLATPVAFDLGALARAFAALGHEARQGRGEGGRGEDAERAALGRFRDPVQELEGSRMQAEQGHGAARGQRRAVPLPAFHADAGKRLGYGAPVGPEPAQEQIQAAAIIRAFGQARKGRGRETGAQAGALAATQQAMEERAGRQQKAREGQGKAAQGA